MAPPNSVNGAAKRTENPLQPPPEGEALIPLPTGKGNG